MPPGNDPAVRTTIFGVGYGLLAVHVDDVAEVIRVFDIAWIG
jgi:hypothetical protein